MESNKLKYNKSDLKTYLRTLAWGCYFDIKKLYVILECLLSIAYIWSDPSDYWK